MRYGEFKMAFLHCNCVLHICYFCMFFLNYFLSKKIMWPIIGLFYARYIYENIKKKDFSALKESLVNKQ